MGKSKKGGLMSRRRAALARLEVQFEAFKKEGKDKEPWTTTRRGGTKTITHKGRSFDQECARYQAEISRLKEVIR